VTQFVTGDALAWVTWQGGAIFTDSPICGPGLPVPAARRSWGEIRTFYR
jgi:hypothetical protein